MVACVLSFGCYRYFEYRRGFPPLGLGVHLLTAGAIRLHLREIKLLAYCLGASLL